jgi:hypothetical protein
MKAPLKTSVKLLGRPVSNYDIHVLGLSVALSVWMAYSLYLFYVHGMAWTSPLGGLCLMLGLCFNNLQPFVNRAATKRVFTLLNHLLICVAVGLILTGFVH